MAREEGCNEDDNIDLFVSSQDSVKVSKVGVLSSQDLGSKNGGGSL